MIMVIRSLKLLVRGVCALLVEKMKTIYHKEQPNQLIYIAFLVKTAYTQCAKLTQIIYATIALVKFKNYNS